MLLKIKEVLLHYGCGQGIPLDILQSEGQLLTTDKFLVQNINSVEIEKPLFMVGLTWWLSGKNLPADAGDGSQKGMGLIPWLRN